MNQQTDEVSSVRHLLELGYVDPDEVSARETISERRYFAELWRLKLLVEQGLSDEALPELEKLIDSDPEGISPRQLLAEIRYRAGQWKEAQITLEWLVCHGVENPRSALMAGGLALAKRELRIALENLEYACHANPGQRGALTKFGTALLRVGRLPAAEQAFRQALALDENDVRALDGLAAIHLLRGEFELATDAALQALERDFQLYRAHYHLGVALFLLRQTDAAMKAFETCVKLNSVRAAPYYWLSKIAVEQLLDLSKSNEYRECGRATVRRRRRRATAPDA